MCEAKLTYFDMTGLGEPVRLMLTAAKIKFEDVRVNKEQWAELKPKVKWPFLPMLEMNGETLFQSLAICRYLATKAGLAGSDPEEALKCDMTVYHLNDMRGRVASCYYRLDSPERDEELKKVAEEDVPRFLTRIEEQLVANDDKFLVGEELTWADIVFLSFCDYLSHLIGNDILESYPKLKNHESKLKEHPLLKEWIKTRPNDPQDFRVHFF